MILAAGLCPPVLTLLTDVANASKYKHVCVVDGMSDCMQEIAFKPAEEADEVTHH